VDNIYEKVIMPPISGSYNRMSQISPRDVSFQLPFYQLRARGVFHIQSSMQNLCAVRVSAGMMSRYELQMYHDWGIKDGIEFWIDNKEKVWMDLFPDHSKTISGSMALAIFSTT
jgi:hypothetical protein